MGVLDELKNKKILVVGDLIVDFYRVLQADRISPEADVIIYHQDAWEWRPGGAANVANNLAALGASVELFTVSGEDWNGVPGVPVKNCISHIPHTIISHPGRKTTIKERLVTKRQQIARIDDQTRVPITEEMASQLAAAVCSKMDGASVVVFSDYDHGVMTDSLVKKILWEASAKNIPMVVDSKAIDTVKKYKGASIILPNLDEAKAITGLADFDEEDIAKYLLKQMRLEVAAITLGSRGMVWALWPNTGKIRGPKQCQPYLLQEPIVTQPFCPLETNTKDEVRDVTGAGDTVTAAIAAGIALNLDLWQIARLAQVAAGIVVRKAWVATSSLEEIRRIIRDTPQLNTPDLNSL